MARLDKGSTGRTVELQKKDIVNEPDGDIAESTQVYSGHITPNICSHRENQET
jgi:hypothetical protein